MNGTAIRSVIARAGNAACLVYVFSSVLSIAAQNIAIGLAALAALAALLWNGVGPWRGNAPRGSLATALLLLAAAVASIAFSSTPEQGWRNLPSFFMILASPLVFMPFVGSRAVSRHLVKVLVLGAAAAALVLVFREPKAHIAFGRFTTFMGVMNFGGALGLLYPPILSLFIGAAAAGDRKRCWILLAALVCLVFGVLMNGTRVIWLSVAATTAFLFFINIGTITRAFVAFLAGLVLATALFFHISPAHRGRLLPPPEVVRIHPNDESNTRLADDEDMKTGFDAAGDDSPSHADSTIHQSNKVRIVLWKSVWDHLSDLPLFGYGLAAAPAVKFDRYYNFAGYREGRFGHYHNTFVNTLAEMGWPGLIALLAAFVPSVVLAARNLFVADAERRLWSRILLAVLLAFAVHSMTDTVLQIRSVMLLFGFLLALCWAHLREDGAVEPLR